MAMPAEAWGFMDVQGGAGRAGPGLRACRALASSRRRTHICKGAGAKQHPAAVCIGAPGYTAVLELAAGPHVLHVCKFEQQRWWQRVRRSRCRAE